MAENKQKRPWLTTGQIVRIGILVSALVFVLVPSAATFHQRVAVPLWMVILAILVDK